MGNPYRSARPGEVCSKRYSQISSAAAGRTNVTICALRIPDGLSIAYTNNAYRRHTITRMRAIRQDIALLCVVNIFPEFQDSF